MLDDRKKTDGLVAVLLAFSFPQKVTLQFSRREEIQTLIVLRIGFHLNVAFCDQNSMVWPQSWHVKKTKRVHINNSSQCDNW